jgi:hypothetical protein
MDDNKPEPFVYKPRSKGYAPIEDYSIIGMLLLFRLLISSSTPYCMDLLFTLAVLDREYAYIGAGIEGLVY